MKELSLDEIRKIQLDILDAVHDFCEERNLRYSLGGGTLLGAVRHKGYIPWDDDIDIMMPRPDYERFIKEFDGYKPQYTCGCWENDRSYVFPFAKVYDNRTLLNEKAVNFNIGINIDVFPIDGVPDQPNMVKKFLRKVLMSRYLLSYKHMRINYHDNLLKKIIGVFICWLPNNLLQKVCKKRTTKYNFEDSKNAGAVMGAYGTKEIYAKDVFLKYILLPFEDRTYYAIAQNDVYLKQHYGDYMKLPPIEKQVPPHSVVAYLLNNMNKLSK